jgi:hypothetical protein
MLGCDLLCGWLLFRLLRDRRLGLSPAGALAGLTLYALLPLLLGHLFYDRFDLVIALGFAAIASLHDPERGPSRISYWLEGLGAAVKGVPAAWFPLTAGADLSRNRRRALVHAALGFSIPCLAVALPYLALTRGSPHLNLGDQFARGIQIESIWATPWLVAEAVYPYLGIEAVFEHGAHHLAGVPGAYVLLAKTLPWVGLALLIGWFITRLRSRGGAVDLLEYHRVLFAVLLYFIASGRVLSPQFLIWTLPGFCVECGVRRPGPYHVAVVALYALTFAIFPHGFAGLIELEPWPIAVAAARNLLLAALCVEAIRTATRDRRPARAEST